MQTILSDRGIKIYIDNNHVKTIPKKYKTVVKACFLETTTKRLTAQEKFMLEVALFKEYLKKHQPLVFNYVAKNKPIKSNKIIVFNTEKPYYEIVFDNNISVVCPVKLHTISPIKKNIFRNY